MIEINLTQFQVAIIGYLFAINVFALLAYGIDKVKAATPGARRTSEKFLWGVALIGGSLGAIIGMKLFRHKTQKLSFQAMLALIIAVQVLIIWLILGRK